MQLPWIPQPLGGHHKEHTSLLSAVFFPRLFEAFLEHSDSGRGEIMHIYKTETEGDRQAGLETVKEGENDWERLRGRAIREQERRQRLMTKPLTAKTKHRMSRWQREMQQLGVGKKKLRKHVWSSEWSTVNTTFLIFDDPLLPVTGRLSLRLSFPALSWVFSPVFYLIQPCWCPFEVTALHFVPHCLANERTQIHVRLTNIKGEMLRGSSRGLY